MADIFEIKM